MRDYRIRWSKRLQGILAGAEHGEVSRPWLPHASTTRKGARLLDLRGKDSRMVVNVGLNIIMVTQMFQLDSAM
jgi:hypothetical protein